MTIPAIIPMRPDEKPTEPGWYAVDLHYGQIKHRTMLSVVRRIGATREEDCLLVNYAEPSGKTYSVEPSRIENMTFIGRINLERIDVATSYIGEPGSGPARAGA